jgi:hypothetical protein
MPWELDHALFFADKLKQGIYNINPEDTIYIDSALNLSSYVIDWESSKLSKDFFIEKYKLFDKIIGNKFQHKTFIYEGNELYGHLDFHKTVKQENVDYYLLVCPDIDFSPNLLYYMIEYAKNIKNKYFVLTPQIFKCWDATWDVLVNENMMQFDYKKHLSVDIHEIRHILNSYEQSTPEAFSIHQFKFAGWFDLYNKKFFEELVPVLSEWKGYGPWDYYAITICSIAKSLNVDVKQYVLKNELIWFYDSGCLSDIVNDCSGEGALKSTYTKFLKKKINRNQQTLNIYQDMKKNVDNWLNLAKNNGII